MLSLLKSKLKKPTPSSHENQGHNGKYHQPPSQPPPGWAPAPEQPHQYGLRNEATTGDFEAAEHFCADYPPEQPRLLPSDAVDRINASGCRAWGIEYPRAPRFRGTVHNPGEIKSDEAVVHLQTSKDCKDTCLLSNLPMVAGLYDVQGKLGMYYEVQILRMDVGEGSVLAIGTACRPYPNWRLPGWNRLSSGLHLDDMRKFFEDPDGGRDYLSGRDVVTARTGDTLGCGYEFEGGEIFFTYNGMRLPAAFSGVYLPRGSQDVYAAIGVSGEVDCKINFGGDLFRWNEGNEWAWRMEGHVGRLTGAGGLEGEELPGYWDASSSALGRR